LEEKSMKRFEFEVPAECRQFLLQDERNENFPEWDSDEYERLLAVAPGILAVGTISESSVRVLLEIVDDEPDEDFGKWDRVNEATINVPSGRVSIGGVDDDPESATLVNSEPGPYRARVYHGDSGSPTRKATGKEHYNVVIAHHEGRNI
jgi:hypothetical protein